MNPRHGYTVGLNNTILEYAVVHALQIQLASFTAIVVHDHTVRLNWRTISEVNNYGFEVQRAAGTPDAFSTLSSSFVPGHGTSSEPHDYAWADQSVPSGRVYYRLKQVDLDGTISYSEPISVDISTGVDEGSEPLAFELKQNYPNPFNPSTRIEFSIANTALVSLRVDVLLPWERHQYARWNPQPDRRYWIIRYLSKTEYRITNIEYPLSLALDLYILPGYQFKVVDIMITNFHLPKSTLLMLASAFAGRERILQAYQAAIREDYRFYSFGDAMLLL